MAFGPFVLDLDARRLLRGERKEIVHLQPKAYELLCVLIAARPRALAKAELHETLWPATYVSEATLASLVADLREALKERGRDSGCIRTVHGFGYAFAGDASDTAVVSPAGSSRSWIVWSGHEMPLPDGEYIIGREDGLSISLRSPSVSRRHAKLVCQSDTAMVEDLGSKNGTFVRGARITSPVVLADGDRITIGAFDLTFRSLAAAGSTETMDVR